MIIQNDPLEALTKIRRVLAIVVGILSVVLLVVCIWVLFTKGMMTALIPMAVALLVMAFYPLRSLLEEQKILLKYCDPQSYRHLYEQKKAAGEDPSELMVEKADFYEGVFDRVIEVQEGFLAQPMPPRQTNQDRQNALFLLAFSYYFTDRLPEAAALLEERSIDIPPKGMEHRLLAFLDEMNDGNFSNALTIATQTLHAQKDDLYRVLCAFCVAKAYEALRRPDAALQMYQHIARVDNKSYFGKQAAALLEQ